MTWRDQLQPGSFRGVPFGVEGGADTTIGRRTILHEFPGRDAPYTEDLGRKAREFTFDLLVIGADYMGARDALMGAIEAPGPGTLIHPWLGTLRVAVTQARMSETTREGGMARFSVTFVLAGDLAMPTGVAFTPALVDAAASGALTAVRTEFAAGFSTTGQPEFLRDAARTVITKALDRMEALVGVLSKATDKDVFATTLADARTRMSDLLADAGGLADLLLGVVSDTAATAPAGSTDALTLTESLADFGAGLTPVSTPTATRQTQADNQAALGALVSTAAAIHMASAAAATSFTSRGDAQAVRGRLLDLLTARAETADDDTYATLADLRVAVARDLADRGALLPDVITHTPVVTLPALVIAHQLYGAATREAEVVARNHVRHPGFVPGGLPLEVLAA
ncbi:MAG: DNA circularization N-terminal domain-containing protein [Nitrospirota bacterium]|nr:DNA circularization N-terminal domain-containing protein [Nitrospirota bacterium]